LLRPRIGQYMPGIDDDKFKFWTNVPLEFWWHAPDGRVPAIESPWAETAQPLSISICGFKFYNPYTATEANSERFFEWQVGNATQAIYGRRMSLEQARDVPYAATPDYPQKNRVDILSFAALLFWLLFGVYLRELSLSRCLGGTRFARCLILIPLVAVLPLAFGDAFYSVSVIEPLLQAVFMHLAAMLPHNWLAFLAIAAAPSLLMYLLVERQFARSEMTAAIFPSFRARFGGVD
jgi:hypothetical protein